MSNVKLGLALAVLLMASPVAASSITGFGDPLSDAALTGGVQQGFDAVADGLYASIALGNVTYFGVDAPLSIGPDFNGNFNTTGGKSIFNDFDLVPTQFKFTFATPVSAFAFNWGAADNSWVLSAFDSSDVLLGSLLISPVFGSNSGEYFGLALANIAYATVVDQKDNIFEGDYVFIDRFTTNAGETTVPEPATVMLLGAGVAAFARRRQLQRQK